MSADERRRAPRKLCAIPLRLRTMNVSESIDVFEGQTLNVSETGIFFTSERLLKIGDPVEMFFTLPRELTGRSPEPIRCRGRIVHVQTERGENGEIGFGAAIGRFHEARAYRSGN
jgi:hypothetical protein